MIGLKTSYEIAYNGTENECRFELYADTASDLQGLTHIDGIKIQMGSECTDIATGDKYLLNGSDVWILQPSQNSFSNVYTTDEIDTMITTLYQYMMYYHTRLVSIDGTITFYTFGETVENLIIYGNGSQTVTPTPANPVMPTFCGKLVGSDWTIPLTCAGQTVPVYLGQVSTVRRIRKLVLTGEENITSTHTDIGLFNIPVTDYLKTVGTITNICSHYRAEINVNGWSDVTDLTCRFYGNAGSPSKLVYIRDSSFSTVADFKAFLAAQYAAGTPVTVWYVLAEPQTGIVNEPLMKIGDYADELHSEDASVTIPTVRGQNVLTVETDLIPSKIVISGGE